MRDVENYVGECGVKRGGKGAVAARIALLAAVILAATGCPTFEDGLTGQYQEIEIGELQDEALAVDFFRFGSEARAVLRRYDIASESARENPFHPDNEISCQWTRVDTFDEANRRFALTIPASARQGQIDLHGALNGAGSLELEVFEEGAEEPREARLEVNSAAPNPNCVTIDDFFLRAIFDDTSNTLNPEVYELRHPVFALLWVGVEPVTIGGGTVFVATNRPEPAFRLQPGLHFNRATNNLSSNLAVSIPPPTDRILMESGSTRFALAHFVVIDDSDDDERFTWEVADEPIIATALERDRPEDVPPAVENREIDGWGKALLFVEGRLDELDQSLLFTLDGVEAAEQDRHFYIVDVFFYNEGIISVRLPPRPEPNRPVQRRVPLQVTEQYLQAGEVSLPRLYDFN